jgi:tetratricopeptide (TPR) repeat protein
MHHFAKAIEKYPGYYEAFYHLGVVQMRLGQGEKAIASFQSAIDLSSGKYALASYAYALMLCKQGKAIDAERTVRYALESGQNKPVGLAVLGTVLLYLHRRDEAEKSARAALSSDPNNADAYLVLAGVHGEERDFAAEVHDLDSFLVLEPQGFRTSMIRGIRDAAATVAVRASSKEYASSTLP